MFLSLITAQSCFKFFWSLKSRIIYKNLSSLHFNLTNVLYIFQHLSTAKASHEKLLRELDQVNNKLKDQQMMCLRMENELKSGTTTQSSIVEVCQLVRGEWIRDTEIMLVCTNKIIVNM